MEKKEKNTQCADNRFDRLSQALRDNLKRRKEFDRVRLAEKKSTELNVQKNNVSNDPT